MTLGHYKIINYVVIQYKNLHHYITIFYFQKSTFSCCRLVQTTSNHVYAYIFLNIISLSLVKPSPGRIFPISTTSAASVGHIFRLPFTREKLLVQDERRT